MQKLLYHIIILLAVGSAAFVGLSFRDQSVPVRVLAIMIVVLLLLLRLPKLTNKLLLTHKLVQVVLVFTIINFLVLLVLITGGFFSPFSIVIHITTLALAFLWTFSGALTFLISSLLVMAYHLYSLYQSGVFTSIDIPLLSVYLISLLAIVPFSWVVASRYHLKGQLADYLYHQLWTTTTQGNVILDSIEEGVITLDKRLQVVRINQIAQKITGYSEDQIRGRPFFSVFSFKNKEGKLIPPENFPLANIMKLQAGFSEKNLFLNIASGSYVRVDFKFSSIIGVNGQAEGLLFIFRDLTSQEKSAEAHSILGKDFFHLFDLISQADQKASRLAMGEMQEDTGKINRAANNLMLLHEISTGYISALVDFVDVGQMLGEIAQEVGPLAARYSVEIKYLPLQNVPTYPMGETQFEKVFPTQTVAYPSQFSLITSRTILYEAFKKLIELGILLASSQKQRYILLDISKDQDAKVRINIYVSCLDFPWYLADELFQPFFGKIKNNTLLARADGLEGYLAKALVKRINGQVIVSRQESSKYGSMLVITAKFSV